MELGRSQQTQDNVLKQSWKLFPDIKPLWKMSATALRMVCWQKGCGSCQSKVPMQDFRTQVMIKSRVSASSGTYETSLRMRTWVVHNILVREMLLHWILESRHVLCLCFWISSQNINLHIAAPCCIRSYSETQVQRKEEPTRIKKIIWRYVWILENNEKIKCQNCRRHETLMTMTWLRTASLFYVTERNWSNARCTVA